MSASRTDQTPELSILTESKLAQMEQSDSSSVANDVDEVAILTDTYKAPQPNKTAKEYFNDFCRAIGNAIQAKCKKLCSCFSGILSSRRAAPNPPAQVPALPKKSSYSSKSMLLVGGGKSTFHEQVTKDIEKPVSAQGSGRPMEIEMSVIDRSKPSQSTRI